MQSESPITTLTKRKQGIDQMTFKIIGRKMGATLENPSRNLIEFEFVKNGENFGGRKYDLTFWNESEAKEDFIKWCGY